MTALGIVRDARFFALDLPATELLKSIKPCLHSLVDTLEIPPMFSEE